MPQPNTDTGICHVCQVARDCGLGFSGRRNEPIKWLCIDCAALIEDIRRIKRMDAYEHKALDKVDEIAGDYAVSVCKTDIAGFDELERRMFWKAIVEGYGNALRDIIRSEAPF